MPMPLAHALLGASLVAAAHPEPTPNRYALPLVAGAVLANLADLDFLIVFATGSKAWHRGFSHSLVFALCIGALFLWGCGARRWRAALAYALAFASHGVLDWLTTKHGGGVALLWPFTAERLIPGWWGLSEVPSKLTAPQIMQALALELALFAPLLIAALLWQRALSRRESRIMKAGKEKSHAESD